jgi:hypothetical protein
MSCVATWQQQVGGGAGAQATVLVAQLGAGVTAGLQHMGAGLGTLHSQMARVVRVAQSATQVRLSMDYK